MMTCTIGKEAGAMVNLPIYMDNNATTRTDPRVVEAMLPYFTEHYGNAASRTHVFGRKAEERRRRGTPQVAALIGASPKEIVFTSGATESDNLALKGVAAMYRHKGDHIITVATEHRAVLDSCRRLEREGFGVTFLPVDKYGRVSADQVAAALQDKTILVSVMAANNEIGTLQPIREIGKVCKERGVFLHSDAVQAVGKIPVDVEDLGVDLLSLTAPQDLWTQGSRCALTFAAVIRASAPNRFSTAAAMNAGYGAGPSPSPAWSASVKPAPSVSTRWPGSAERLLELRHRLQRGIVSQLDQVFLNGHPTERLTGNLNLSFVHVEGEALLMALKDIAVSSGSACTSANLEPSYVLKALGVGDDLAHGSIRFGLGRFNTSLEVDYVVAEVVRAVNHLRALNPMWELDRQSALSHPAHSADLNIPK